MKGLYSNPDALHGRTANQSMFPDNQFFGAKQEMPQELAPIFFVVKIYCQRRTTKTLRFNPKQPACN